VSNIIQDLLRDPPPTMILDMGLGSREQSLPIHDSRRLRVIASEQDNPADFPSA
jgi:hypothetical protein